MIIQQNISLQTLNSFGITVNAQAMVVLSNESEVSELFSSIVPSFNKFLILGGGSNILFTQDFAGLIIKNELSGIAVEKEDEDHVWIRSGAGVNWHEFVMHCIDNNWGGIENLSLIPGTVGAAPVQNIGAYGVELKDCFHLLNAWHIEEKKWVEFNAEQSQFGYRNSVFKNELKGKVLISSIVLKLSKKHNLQLEYGAIRSYLSTNQISEPTIRDVSNAVIAIRQSKLPDPKQIGNAGSFFKNPIVSWEHLESLLQKFPDLVSYPSEEGVKLAAGWLIEKAGWKGKRDGDVGAHPQQALVIVNYGSASGKEIYTFSQKIRQSVYDQFNIMLESEVNII